MCEHERTVVAAASNCGDTMCLVNRCEVADGVDMCGRVQRNLYRLLMHIYLVVSCSFGIGVHLDFCTLIVVWQWAAKALGNVNQRAGSGVHRGAYPEVGDEIPKNFRCLQVPLYRVDPMFNLLN